MNKPFSYLGAIVRRHYTPARIAELRSDFRHVTI